MVEVPRSASDEASRPLPPISIRTTRRTEPAPAQAVSRLAARGSHLDHRGDRTSVGRWKRSTTGGRVDRRSGNAPSFYSVRFHPVDEASRPRPPTGIRTTRRTEPAPAQAVSRLAARGSHLDHRAGTSGGKEAYGHRAEESTRDATAGRGLAALRAGRGRPHALRTDWLVRHANPRVWHRCARRR